MKKKSFKISGGAKVHSKLVHNKIKWLLAVPVILLLMYPPSALAQGSIYGSVTNSNLSVPANGEISFFGFLDDTDEEIRIETCVGAGYDAGNWFDDFQNFLTEAPGNPYDYYFYNTANSESAILSDLIPNNSFQQEDIALATVAGWPSQPAGLSGTAVSGSSVIIKWHRVSGRTYHVYRRLATSGGSFFRIDDVTGSLANPGVADSFFVDNTVNGTSDYHYLIIAEDASGNLSPHSDILTVSSATIAAPVLVSIEPNAGPYIGGTSVTISGSEFDMNGVTVTIGSSQLTSVTVVSPYEITGNTPAGAEGAFDVTVTNTASGLPSNILTDGFTYEANQAPVLAAIGAQTTTEDVQLNFTVTALDPDGTTPSLRAEDLPGAATFTDNGDGSAVFDWTPLFTEAGTYQVRFIAEDGIAADSELVDIEVAEAGNQQPVLDPITTPQTVAENDNLNFNVTASDPDDDIPTLSATGLPDNSTFTDNLDGTGTFDFSPDFEQAGSYEVVFKAFDGILVDSGIVDIEVTNTNREPVLAAIGARATDEGVQLTFGVSATDDDGETITLSTTTPLPGTALFTDNGDGTGLFDWTPTYTDEGVYSIMFYAGDGTDIDSELVDITVNDAGNQAPVLDPIGPLSVAEGAELIQTITASDPDGTTPTFTAEDMPDNSEFLDNGDGTGTFTFNPDYTQAGVYDVRFIATDGTLSDSELVAVTVTEEGNQSPIITPINDTLISEGDSLVLVVEAYDPDGSGVTLTVSSDIPASDYLFVDSGNGIGVFSYESDYFDGGTHGIYFFATDFGSPPASASIAVAVEIAEVNQSPVIEPIGPFGVEINDNLTFTVTASDSTDPVETHRLFLTATGLPNHSSFTDNGDNTGTFSFDPDNTQIGVHTITVIATDMGTPQLSAQLPIEITVVTVNYPPEWGEYPSALTVFEGETAGFTITATDPDGGTPVLYTYKQPENSTFTDNGDGTGDFSFEPDYIQSGLYQLILVAYDGIDDTKTDPILIQVYEAGNQNPVFDPVPEDTVLEGESMSLTVVATDPDASTPSLTAENLPENATFTDNGDGTGTIEFSPSYVQSGTYYIDIIADDGELTTTIIVTLVVEEAGNQTPVLADIPDQTIDEMGLLTFDISASDPDLDVPLLTATDLPEGATFTDNGDGTGTFSWQTDNFDAGTYVVNFTVTDALDAGLQDTKPANITVNDVNQAPYFDIPGQQRELFEGESITFYVYGIDPDGTIPSIVINSPDYSLADNMTWVDNGDGSGELTFSPDYNQGSISPGTSYYMQWLIVDAEDEELYVPTAPPTKFTVYNTNRPPAIVIPTKDTSIVEGGYLQLLLTATDPDGQSCTISSGTLPDNATFTGITFQKTFRFSPDYTQVGSYEVIFTATDGDLDTTETLNITVTEAGNQAPYFTSTHVTNQPIVAGEGHTTTFVAEDPESETLTITPSQVPSFGVFTDNGDGTATMVMNPVTGNIGEIYDITFTVTDPYDAYDEVTISYEVVEYVRGDANADDALDMSDIMYILNFLYKDGPEPPSPGAADVNFDGALNLLDAEYLIKYFYKSGPAPVGSN